MKKILMLAIAFIAILTVVGCTPAKLEPQQQAMIDSQTTVYTQSSMWIDRNRVYGVNYSRGMHVPINTQVKILEVNSKTIVFSYLGAEISYYVSSKQTKIDASQTLKRLFATKPVNLSKYSKGTKDNILAGKVAVGMTKDEVLLSRGYPPLHATLSIQADLWKYWHHRFKTSSITFKNGKVSSMQGGVF